MSLSRKRRLSADDENVPESELESTSMARKILLGGSSGVPSGSSSEHGHTLPMRMRKLDFSNLIERELMGNGNEALNTNDEMLRNRKTSLTMRLLQEGKQTSKLFLLINVN